MSWKSDSLGSYLYNWLRQSRGVLSLELIIPYLWGKIFLSTLPNAHELWVFQPDWWWQIWFLALCECQDLFCLLLPDDSYSRPGFPHMHVLISILMNSWRILSLRRCSHHGLPGPWAPSLSLRESSGLCRVSTPCMAWKLFQGSTLDQLLGSPCQFSVSQRSLSFLAWCLLSFKFLTYFSDLLLFSLVGA